MDLTGTSTRIIEEAGPLALALLLYAETVFPPIPSEAVLPFAGYQAQLGALHFGLGFLAATIGSVLGALTLYAVGRSLGEERMRRLSHKRWFLLASPKDLDRGFRLFGRHGTWLVFAGRCVPFVRSVISIPAGIDHMPMRRFLLATVVGTAAWNALLMGLGYGLSNHWEKVGTFVGPLSTGVVALVIAGFATLMVRRVRHRRALPNS